VESFDRGTLVAANKKQNRPEAYLDIVRLCREHGIGSHFSNILGFPQDTEETINEHLDVLRSIAPNWASFYILCPIPGTEQYDTFLSQGLITERNLDRFDTTSLTWRHPSFTAARLSELLYECYRKFTSLQHSFQNIRNVAFQHGRGNFIEQLGSLAMSSFIRYCAWRKTHPMSGGVMRVRLDSVSNYMDLRKRTFGFELVPLPQSLKLHRTESPKSPTERVAALSSQTLSII
jgi:hypothetical protein